MTAITRNAAFRAWRFSVSEGDTVGIASRGAEPTTGVVLRSNSASVNVRDAATGYVYRFRRASGNAVNHCTVFMVPLELERS